MISQTVIAPRHGLDRYLFLAAPFMTVCVGMSLLVVSNAALAKEASPDPRELIGSEFVDANFPDGWKRLGDLPYGEDFGIASTTVTKRNTFALVLEATVEVLDKQRNSRRWRIVDAVRLRARPGGFNGYDVTSQCIGPSPTAAKDVWDKSLVVFAEVRFKHCQRYSSRISKAWLIDMKAQKIISVPTEGMRCEDIFFNNGPDGPTCPPITKEW
ncbi:MAG: hypothetical protein Q7U97_04780 [Rhodocyclaceae bacterium]|nr:hypothetical protein [Rhodocyclaceae bacterium]